jgi:hypothetical protein
VHADPDGVDRLSDCSLSQHLGCSFEISSLARNYTAGLKQNEEKVEVKMKKLLSRSQAV